MNSQGWEIGWPDWCDAGKRVEILTDADELIVGTLIVDDWFPDGEGGEVPVFAIETDQGTVSFADHKQWRYK